MQLYYTLTLAVFHMNEQSTNYISLKKIGLDVMYKVTHCAGRISVNTRQHAYVLDKVRRM